MPLLQQKTFGLLHGVSVLRRLYRTLMNGNKGGIKMDKKRFVEFVIAVVVLAIRVWILVSDLSELRE